MSNNTSHISVPLKGMNRDLHPANLTEQGYDFALNAVIEEFDGNGFPLLQNEPSTLHCVNFPVGSVVMGFVNIIEQDRRILFLLNPETGLAEIGEIKGKVDCDDKITDGSDLSYCDSCGDAYIPEKETLENQPNTSCCTYRTIIPADCLTLNINNPVRAVYRLNDCSLEIFFTDNSQPYRHIEFNYENDDITGNLILDDAYKVIIGFDEENCDTPIYGDDIDCNKLLIDPILDIPCVELVDILQGGELKAGVYQFLFAYAESDGTKRSTYFPATNQIPLFTRQITFETDYNTNRSISVQVTGINEEGSPFSYFNIAVAKTINNVTSFEFLGTYPITQKTILYTGVEKTLKDITPDEIFAPKVYYAKSKYIAQANDYLFHAGLEETKKLNIQRIANNVKLNWQTVAIPEAVYKTPRFVNKFRSYMRDEVYAFGLVLIYDNGEESVVGHIPGPSKQYFSSEYGINVDQIIANADVLDDPSCADLERNKRWQVYNTAQVIYTNPSVPITDTCDDNKCYQYGDFGYWESTELYPNNPEIWGDLCGQPIRHHKFPDSLVTHIHDGLNGTKAFTDGNIVFPIGVRVNVESIQDAISTAIGEGIITVEDAERIKGFRIVRGNRFGNKSIIAKGLIYDVWNYVKDGLTTYYPNYPYNDLRSDQFLTENKDTYDDHDDKEGPDLPFRKTSRFTFHSPDTHFVQPELGDELKLETLEYGKSEGYFNHCEDEAKQKMLSTTSYLLALAGGAVAMFTAVNEVREKTYTVRGGTTELGPDGIPIITGTIPGAIATVPGLSLPTTKQNTVTVPALGTVYDNNSGIPIPPLGIAWEINTLTKQGTREQMFSASAPIVGSILDPVIGGIIGVFAFANAISYKLGLMLTETQIIVNLIKSLAPKLNYCIQYNSVGKYNNFQNVTNAGFKRRKLDTYSYLKPEISAIDESVASLGSGLTTIRFNNWNRETSVYLKIDTSGNTFATPAVTDNSRFPIGCRGSSSCDFKNFDKLRYYRDISSFYSSVKQYLPDQYGRIANIEYIDTGHCAFIKDSEYADCELAIFGGDTFINRFALKRKHPFFTQTRFNQQDETDVKYSDLGNVAYPYYYYDTTTGLGQDLADGGSIGDIFTDPATALGRPKSYLDAKTNKFFYQNGRIYLYSYGIPYFLVESDVNVDMRHGENSKEKDFFPHQQDLDFWLQEKNVSIREDNYYFYNSTYSKQNKEHPYAQYAVDFEPGRMCKMNYPNRVIYSNGSQWLSYLANDFKNFGLENGRITGIDGLENDKVLVRFDNTFQVFNAYVTIPTSADSIQVSTGGMFQSKPQEFAKTTLGYGGSQSNAILHTEFGHIWVDVKRGNVFNLQGGNLDEISKNGMKNWFKENLPFQVLKDFPNINVDDTDNNFKGIGLCLGFDKRFNRFLLTKLDYKVLNSDIVYDAEEKVFLLDDEEVRLDDKKYFCDKSWTLSYNFYTKAWTSYHSYKPNYYIDNIDYFISGVNNTNPSGISSQWIHNSTNKSYQVFYGKLWPFTIQTVSKGDINKNNLNSVEYALDVIRYHNEFDPFYTTNITFNKAVVFNAMQNSGLLELMLKNGRDLSEIFPIANTDSTTIRVTNADGIWRFNQFYDLAVSRTNNVPLWLNDCANVDKKVNPMAVDYQTPDLNKKRIRGEYNRIKLINDKHSKYKFIFKWLVNKSVKTYR